MPELPEVEAVCRRLRESVLGASIVRFQFARPAIARPQDPGEIEARVAGTNIDAIERRGKNILLHLRSGLTMHVHLRMTGNLYAVPDPRFRPVSTRAWWELAGGRGILFEDSRALGRIHVHPTAEILERLDKTTGVEPLSAGFTEEYFLRVAKRSGKPSKLFLMDQKHVAGLGNIYAAEALFRARIHPQQLMRRISAPRLRGLHAAMCAVLQQAVQSAALAYAVPGQFQEGESFPCAVYDREGEACTVCSGMIRRIPQGGRSTYFCPKCQRGR